MIVSMIYCLLQDVKQDMGKIPPVLHLSLDNCYRENKNRFVLSFLAALVQQNILSEVNVTFLLVGHTVGPVFLNVIFVWVDLSCHTDGKRTHSARTN